MRAHFTSYPSVPVRRRALALVVAVTVVQYYAVYVHGSVATLIIRDYGMSLRYYVLIAIVGNLVGGMVAFTGAAADRIGRVPLLLGGLAATTLITGLAIPAAGTKEQFLLLTALANAAEGIVLVAAPALVRDLSPQSSRGAAMGAWAMGPVLGSLVVTGVAAATTAGQADWRVQYRLCGMACLVVGLLAAATLRDLAPQVRNRAIGAAPARGATGRIGVRVALPALGFGLYEVFYFTVVAFFVLFATTTLGYPVARANALELCFFLGSGSGFVAFGWLGDRLGVRRPVIAAGTLASALAMSAWVLTVQEAGFGAQAVLLASAGFAGSASVSNWLAAYSETLEDYAPGAIARGMAVLGALVRFGVVATLVGVGLVAPASGTLAAHRAAPSVLHAAAVDAPGQWQVWWWLCIAARLLFLPTILLLRPDRGRVPSAVPQAAEVIG